MKTQMTITNGGLIFAGLRKIRGIKDNKLVFSSWPGCVKAETQEHDNDVGHFLFTIPFSQHDSLTSSIFPCLNSWLVSKEP